MSETPEKNSTAEELLPAWAWGVDVVGTIHEELGKVMAEDTIAMLRLLATNGYDLRTLDGVTIASDYPKALSEIDRGFSFPNAPKPTNENGLEGVAMALGVLREGRQRTRLVLSSWIPFLLRSEDEAQRRKAFGTIAHEAAHIHFAAKLGDRIPGMFGKPPALTEYVAEVQIAALHIWDEYAATRFSGYIDPEASASYEDNIRTLVLAADSFRIDRIIQYRMHGDHKLILSDLVGLVERLLCSLAYLWGHLDGAEELLNPPNPMSELLITTPGLSEIAADLKEKLRALWDTQDTWTAQEVFLPLCGVVDRLLEACGVHMTKLGDSWSMQIPHTPETMPTRDVVEDYCNRTGTPMSRFYG